MGNIKKANQEALDTLRKIKEKGGVISEDTIRDVKESHRQFLLKQEKNLDEREGQIPVNDIERYSSTHSNSRKKKYVVKSMLSLLGFMSIGVLIFYLWKVAFCANMKLEDVHVFLRDGKVKYLSSYYLNEAKTYKECLNNLSYFPLDINIDSLDYNLPYYPATYFSETGENVDVNLTDYKKILLSENIEYFRKMEAMHNDSTDDKRIEDGLNLFKIIGSDEFYVSFVVRKKHAIAKNIVDTTYKVPTVYWNCIRPIRDRKDDFVFKDILLRDIVAKCSVIAPEDDGEGRIGMEHYAIFCTLKNDYIVAYPFHLGFDDNLIEYYNVIPVKELDEKLGETLVELAGGENLSGSYNICSTLIMKDNLFDSLVSYLESYDKNDVINYFERNIGRHINIWNNEKLNRRLYKLLGVEETNRIKEFSVVGVVKQEAENKHILSIFYCYPHFCDSDNVTISINTRTGMLSVHVENLGDIRDYIEFN